MDKKRTISPPLFLQKWLKDLPIKQVAFFADLYDKGGHEIFDTFLMFEVDRHKNKIYKLPEANPVALAIEKAAHRGAVEEVDTIKQLIRAARKELERRIVEAEKK